MTRIADTAARAGEARRPPATCRFWVGRRLDWSFSLLFPMHRVFEAFVVGFMRRDAPLMGLEDVRIEAQAQRRHLARDEGGEPQFALRPDMLGIGPAWNTRFVLDTKWKVVSPAAPVDDVATGDAYQIFAYSERFNSPLSILLYPRTGHATPTALRFEQSERLLRLAFIDLGRDLRREAAVVAAELRLAFRSTASS